MSIISVAVEAETMATDDLTQWEHVDDEEEGSKYGTLWNTLVDRCSGGA